MRLDDPLDDGRHRAWEAEARRLVPDASRGGPPIHGSASPLPPFTGVDRATAVYVGPEACGACHPDALSAWSPTAHAGAVATLEAAGRPYDPSCLRCHTTGLGHPGGFGGTGLPGLAAVSCEACHGPGSDHVVAPAQGYGALPEGGAACVACHTHDNSPTFDRVHAWPRIAH